MTGPGDPLAGLVGRTLSRVLVTLPSTALGGTEAHTASLARALAVAGVAVTVALDPPLREGFAAMLGNAPGVRLRPATIGWQPRDTAARNIGRQAAALPALLAAARPEAVVLPLPWPTHGLGLLQALAEAGPPALAICHLAPHEPEAPLDDAARAALATLAGARLHWAAVSAPVAARVAALLDLPPAGFAVVPNGVPVPNDDPAGRAAARAGRRRQLGLADEAKLLVFAGRLELTKGADLLPEIATRLAAACDATLAVLGEGSLRAVLEQGKPGRRGGPLRLLGQVHDVPDWLLAADVLLLPSRIEGCPLIFLEAAARRCPVVASGDALECYGAAAVQLAGLAPSGGIAALTDQAIVRLNDPAAARATVDAAFRTVVALDEAAMLRRYFSLLRAAIA